MERVLGNAKIGGSNLPTRITDLIEEFSKKPEINTGVTTTPS